MDLDRIVSTAGARQPLLLARAVIAAAAADGSLAAQETLRTGCRMDGPLLTAQMVEQRLPCGELIGPLKLHEIAEQARAADAELAVYIASLVTVDRNRPQGRIYLADLAEILGLPPLLVRRIHECHERLSGPYEVPATGWAA